MGHFTGSDMNELSIRAFRAYSQGNYEEALELGRQVYEAYRTYYGPNHNLTLAAKANMELYAARSKSISIL